jgi:uroporphyrin-3 C-methyltransferase
MAIDATVPCALLEWTSEKRSCPMSQSPDRTSSPAAADGGLDSTPTALETPLSAPLTAGGRRAMGASRLYVAAAVAIAIAAALAVWADGRRTQQALRVEVTRRLAGVEVAAQEAGKAQTELATELRDARARTALVETRIAESQAQQAALEALYRDLAPSRDEIALSEIEQVLLVASQQLQLAGNVPSAMTALQLADAKLQRLDRPQFVPLRRALSREMDDLKAVPYVDVTGVGLKLDQAITLVGTLPLAMDERLPAPAATPVALPDDTPSWQRLLHDFWGEMRQLVRLEKSDRPAASLLPPSQAYFLRENLRLRLLTARLALLNHDDESFKADLAAVGGWLAQYFDTRSKQVQALQATVKQVAATPLAGEMPDLSRSLEALRVLRLARDRAPARTPGAPTAR